MFKSDTHAIKFITELEKLLNDNFKHCSFRSIPIKRVASILTYNAQTLIGTGASKNSLSELYKKNKI